MNSFDVIVVSFKLNGAEPLARVLERVLVCSTEQARALARRFPSTVGSGLEEHAAEKLADTLRTSGARIQVVPHAAAATEPSTQVQPIAASNDDAPPGVAGFTDRVREPLLPPSPLDPELAKQESVLARASSPDVAFKLGSLRVEPPKRESLIDRFVVGTLRIVLPAKLAPAGHSGGSAESAPLAHHVSDARPVTAPGDAEAFRHAADLSHEHGMLDDVLSAHGDQAPLELDDEALQQRSMQVSGGRAQERPSLMVRMGHSISDIPARVVRRARRGAGTKSRALSWWLPTVLVVGIASMLFVAHASTSESHVGGASEGATSEQSYLGKAPDPGALMAPEPALHPLLKLAPEPMQASLAAILRRKVNGVHAVTVEWPEGRNPDAEGPCMLVSGTADQRRERVNALLATGKKLNIPASVASQLRDHVDVLRAAENDARANYTSLCLGN